MICAPINGVEPHTRRPNTATDCSRCATAFNTPTFTLTINTNHHQLTGRSMSARNVTCRRRLTRRLLSSSPPSERKYHGSLDRRFLPFRALLKIFAQREQKKRAVEMTKSGFLIVACVCAESCEAASRQTLLQLCYLTST